MIKTYKTAYRLYSDIRLLLRLLDIPNVTFTIIHLSCFSIYTRVKGSPGTQFFINVYWC